jgi:hypothetical protein
MIRLSQIEADYYDPDRHLWTPYDDQDASAVDVDDANPEQSIPLTHDVQLHKQDQIS